VEVMTMTSGFPGHRAGHVAWDGDHSRVARRAVGIAAADVAVLAVVGAVFGTAWLVGGTEATEDNWVGMLGAAGIFGGLAASVVALVLAALARSRHETWSMLWLPLLLAPGLLLLLGAVELFWME
jgi:hypothetical protein